MSKYKNFNHTYYYAIVTAYFPRPVLGHRKVFVTLQIVIFPMVFKIVRIDKNEDCSSQLKLHIYYKYYTINTTNRILFWGLFAHVYNLSYFLVLPLNLSISKYCFFHTICQGPKREHLLQKIMYFLIIWTTLVYF